MSNRSILMKAEPLRSIAFGAVGGAYAAVGTPFAFPSHIIHIQNTMDQGILVSYDGVTDNEFVAAGGYILLDISSNKTRSEGFFFPVNMTVYVKEAGAGPTIGNVYVSTYYGTDNNF